MNPKFSIIIPIYKVEDYIRECIDSVLSQTYQNMEVLLVDDGSPDACPKICDEYAKIDVRVRAIHKSNGGLSDARNLGLKNAIGDYVIFIDSDDYYNNSYFLENIASQLLQSPVDILCHQRQNFIDGKPETLASSNPYKVDEITEGQYGCLVQKLSANDHLDASACMKVLKRSFLLDNELFFKKGIYSEDIEWFMRVLLSAKQMTVTNETAYCYRLRATSISHNVKLKNVQDLFYSIETYAYKFEQHMDKALRAGVLNYLAYQYFIILGYTRSNLNGKERNMMFTNLKQYSWLIRYATNRKTKICALICRCLGLTVTSFILGKYMNLK